MREGKVVYEHSLHAVNHETPWMSDSNSRPFRIALRWRCVLAVDVLVVLPGVYQDVAGGLFKGGDDPRQQNGLGTGPDNGHHLQASTHVGPSLRWCLGCGDRICRWSETTYTALGEVLSSLRRHSDRVPANEGAVPHVFSLRT